MNNSGKLRFRSWHKPEVVFDLLDWRPESGTAIIVDAKGERQVLSLVLPGIRDKGPLGFTPIFPSAIRIEIEEIALLPPPCRATREEANVLRAEAAEEAGPGST